MRLFSAAILSFAVSCCAFGQTYTINTFAGGGLGVNIPGTSASLSYPVCVAVDGAGNLFLGDQANNVVLRLDARTGILTLVAGNGTQGFSGDNGPATSAQLHDPTGVAVDAAGNLYIADSDNGRIRKVSNGIIVTVAGNGTAGYSGDNGPATSAGLSDPVGVALDSAGNLYVADTLNQRIRQVSNGVITTVAGNGTWGYSGDNGPAVCAQLSSPQGVAVDAAGHLYIADTGNSRIREVSNGVITTFAGIGLTRPNEGGYGGDNGAATSALLNTPEGVAVDAAGNLYIADTWNSRIRKVSNGVITTVAGSGGSGPGWGGYGGDNGPATSARLNNPRGVAVDAVGNLYVADSTNCRIRRVSNGVIATVVGGGNGVGDNGPALDGQLDYPMSVAVDAAGDLYIADDANNRIRKVSNGVITTVVGIGTPGYSGDGGPAISAQLQNPDGIAVDAAGNLYIADTLNYRVRKVSNGVITTIAGTGTSGSGGDNGPAVSAQLGLPERVAVDGAGNVYILDGETSIRKVSNGVITTVARGLDQPMPGSFYSFCLDSSGDAYVFYGYGVEMSTGYSGNEYVQGYYFIGKITNGVVATLAGGQEGFGGDNGPAGKAVFSGSSEIAVDAGGNLYIADGGNNRVRRISNGVITTIAGNGSPGFSGDGGPAANALLNGPHGVTVDASGKVYVIDNARIRVLTPSSQPCSASVTPLAFSPAASGGNVTLTVQTSSACAWAVQSLPDWITFSGSAVASGPASVTLGVAANLSAARSATVSIAGFSVEVDQQGLFPSIAAVTNAASNLPGAISPGEIVALYGVGLGPTQLVKAVPGSNGSYGTQLANTSVSFNGIAAPMIYSWATQVAAIVPYGITGNTAQVTVTYQGQTSAAATVSMAPSAPGVFSLDSTGQGQAAAINQDGVTVNGAATPAKIGDYISLYATGEGQTTPAGVDGKPASAPYPKPNLPVTVTVGGQNVPAQYAGGAPGLVAGLMQVNVRIPAGIAVGNAVPVVLRVGGAVGQSGVTISVADPATPVLAQLSPSHASAGSSSLTLTVTGSNFQDNVACAAVCGVACPLQSVIRFDQTDIPTQFVSTAQVQGTLPASLLATPRSVAVTVDNPMVIQCQSTNDNLSGELPFTVGP
jgi:uncharacterized protein (TIGR03437 family)